MQAFSSAGSFAQQLSFQRNLEFKILDYVYDYEMQELVYKILQERIIYSKEIQKFEIIYSKEILLNF